MHIFLLFTNAKKLPSALPRALTRLAALPLACAKTPAPLLHAATPRCSPRAYTVRAPSTSYRHTLTFALRWAGGRGSAVLLA